MRPGTYVQPGPVDMSQQMDAAAIQLEGMQTKRAVEAIHRWVTDIAMAVDNHASAIDASDIDMSR